MINKGQPEEIRGKPLISKGDPKSYLGRIIIELWQQPTEFDADKPEPNFVWAIDKADYLSDADWSKYLLDGLKKATGHIENVYRQQDKQSSPEG